MGTYVEATTYEEAVEQLRVFSADWAEAATWWGGECGDQEVGDFYESVVSEGGSTVIDATLVTAWPFYYIDRHEFTVWVPIVTGEVDKDDRPMIWVGLEVAETEAVPEIRTVHKVPHL